MNAIRAAGATTQLILVEGKVLSLPQPDFGLSFGIRHVVDRSVDMDHIWECRCCKLPMMCAYSDSDEAPSLSLPG